MLRVLMLCVLSLTACVRAPRTISDAHASAMRDSVQHTLSLFRQYTRAGQWDSVASLYADDSRFRWVENGVVRYRAPAEIRQAMASLTRGTRIESTYHDTEIIPIAPGIASVVTGFQTRIGDSASAGFTFGGAITMTLIHGANGWRILGGHTSAPIARPR